MTEHESNLLDLYAGLAMMGLIIEGKCKGRDLIDEAWVTAWAMIEERVDDREIKEKPVPDVAVPDVERREDSDTQGIAALKKTKARPKPT